MKPHLPTEVEPGVARGCGGNVTRLRALRTASVELIR